MCCFLITYVETIENCYFSFQTFLYALDNEI